MNSESPPTTSKPKKEIRMTHTEYHVFISMRRVKRAISFKRILDLTGVKKKELKQILEMFEANNILFSPEKNYFGLSGNYHGTHILRYEYEAMKDLEKIIGKPIPLVEKVDLTFGYVCKNHRIVELGLYKCHITNLPNSISHLKILEVLDLGYNDLTDLPKCLTNLTKISRLNLMWNHFTTLPVIIRQIVTINELEFQGNKLSELPDWIHKLTFLDAMDFSHNQLSSLNPKICDHPNLKYLDVWNNKLHDLPSKIGNLRNLERLSVSNNKLENLPQSIEELPSLKLILLDKNEFSTFPTQLLNIKSLKKIDLSYNNLTEIPKSQDIEIVCMSHKGNEIASLHRHREEDLKKEQQQ